MQFMTNKKSRGFLQWLDIKVKLSIWTKIEFASGNSRCQAMEQTLSAIPFVSAQWKVLREQSCLLNCKMICALTLNIHCANYVYFVPITFAM